MSKRRAAYWQTIVHMFQAKDALKARGPRGYFYPGVIKREDKGSCAPSRSLRGRQNEDGGGQKKDTHFGSEVTTRSVSSQQMRSLSAVPSQAKDVKKNAPLLDRKRKTSNARVSQKSDWTQRRCLRRRE